MEGLPLLIEEDLSATRDYIRDVAKAVGAFQRAFIKKHPRDWHYGLEVYMRGISTQPFIFQKEEKRVLIDLHTSKVRLDDQAWLLDEYAGPEILNNLRFWLESRGFTAEIEAPKFNGGGRYNDAQAKAYFEALWWLNRQFQIIKAGLKGGVTAPVLLYPHHFDLSLVWFPWDDERQLALGWSTGDENIRDPYIYLTAYPEPKDFNKQKLPAGAYWQTDGFSGAILPYNVLQSAPHPDKLLQDFAAGIFSEGQKRLAGDRSAQA